MRALWTIYQESIAQAAKADELFSAGVRDAAWTGVVWVDAGRGDLERPRRDAAA